MMGRHTNSMDLNSHMAAKPYMSQPVLGNLEPAHGHDGSESYSSNSTTSPNYSPRRTEITIPDHREASQRSAPANVSRHAAVAMGVVNGTAVSMSIGSAKGLSLDGLPSDPPHSYSMPASTANTRGFQPSGLPSSAYQHPPHSSQVKVMTSTINAGSGSQPKPADESSGITRFKVQGGTSNKRDTDVASSHTSTSAKAKSQGTAIVSSEPIGPAFPPRTPPKNTKVSSEKGRHFMEVHGTSSDENPDNNTHKASGTASMTADADSHARPSTSASALSTSTTSSSATITPRTYRKADLEAIPPVPALPDSITQTYIPNKVPSSSSSTSQRTAAASPPPLTPTRSATLPLSPHGDSSSVPSFIHDAPSSSTFPSRRPFTAPRLTSPLPGHTRFSLTDGDGGSARLSPSIIIRQPAWPILHLPPVEKEQGRPSTSPGPSSLHSPLGGTVISNDGSGTVGRRGSITTGPRLRHMPALPMAGQNEEGDDDELVDEDDVSSSSDDDSDEHEVFVDAEEDEEGEETTSIHRSSTEMTSRGLGSHLPMVDTSRIDLSFINRDKDDVATPKATSSSNATRTPVFGQQQYHDYFSGIFSSSQPGKTPRATPFSTPFTSDPPPLTIKMPPMPRSTNNRGSNVHKQASRSMFDLSAIMSDREDHDGVLDHAAGIGRRDSKVETKAPVKGTSHRDNDEEDCSGKASSSHPVPSIVAPTPKLAPLLTSTPTEHDTSAGKSSNGSSGLATPASPQLRRRRSMPVFTPSSPPPPYPSFAPLYPLAAQLLPPPPIDAPSSPPPFHHPEEGHERLPPYTNDIYLRAIMPRKMEFSQPNVQAKDRKWRRVVCELEGTVFRVYRCPAKWVGSGRSGKVVDWWERKVGVGDVSVGVGIGGGTGGAIGSITNAGTGGTVGVHLSGDGDGDEAEMARRRRQQKLDGDDGGPQPETTEVRLGPRTSPREQTNRGRTQDRGAVGRGRGQEETLAHQPKQPSRSRLANLLKPSKSHGRSNSDVSNQSLLASGADSPPSRSSFNLPRPSFGVSRSSGPGSTTSQSDNSITEEPRNPLRSIRPSPSRQSLTASGTGTGMNTDPPWRPGASCPEPEKEDLIKAYTLQHAESGLGNDYVKRKNVIRVRMEGEQFLIQARDVPEVVAWIEGLHAAANIALDLDERPMPRGPLFPRRRRRRPRRAGTDTSNANGNEAQTSDGRTGLEGLMD
ncbi:hypothetical protein VNI00_016830 [Paramarasmius palmivorus]|uniref:PH domain-containing protein n=1 Tax=Paramarasmius palmivorus TaxID=297713 RepID=A0AAW0BAU4_9AGAR